MKLGIKIPLIFGLIILVISASISVTSISISSRILMQTILDAMQAETRANADVISERLGRQLDIMFEIANRARTRTMNWEVIQPNLVPDVPRIGALDIAFVTPDGHGRYVFGENTVEVADRDYFKKAMRGEKNVEVVVSRITGAVVVLYAVPIFRDDNPGAPVLGVLFARKDGIELSRSTNNLDTSMETGSYFIIDTNGTPIAHANTDLVINQFNAIVAAQTDSQYRSLADSIQRALRERSGHIDYTFNGNYTKGYFTNIDGFPWKLVFTMNQAEFDEKIAQVSRRTIGIANFLILAGLLITFFIGRSIAKPIRKVTDTLKDISEGEGDLTKTIAVMSKDETGELALYFNRTLEKIKSLIITIKGETVTLSDVGSTLAGNMDETASAINEMTATIQSVKGRAINQSASVTQTHATMDQLTENINKLNEHVENQNTHIAQASASIEQMVANIQSVTDTLAKNSANVKSLTDASEVGRTGLQDVSTDIQEIARQSEGLLEINAVMQNIASQTNLLSMNAAIEAAHAGEVGKGFAVVADEIRKLAENSNEQSKTIGNVLKKIKESIDKITRSTENVLNKFEAIDLNVRTVAQQESTILRAMEEQGAGSRQILEGIGEINEITRHVRSSSHEMLEGAKEVITEANNMEKAAQEITSGMNEMASGADQINVSVHQVNEISHKNRDGIGTLVNEVSRFKVC